MNDFDRFFVDAVQRGLIVIELIRRLVNQVEPQQRRALAEIVRHGNPPVDHLFFSVCFRVVFIFISLVGNDGDHAILFAGLHQLTQMD